MEETKKENLKSFFGFDGFKDISNGSIVKDREGYLFRVLKEQGKITYLDLLYSPREPDISILKKSVKKIPIYWSIWTIMEEQSSSK